MKEDNMPKIKMLVKKIVPSQLLEMRYVYLEYQKKARKELQIAEKNQKKN